VSKSIQLVLVRCCCQSVFSVCNYDIISNGHVTMSKTVLGIANLVHDNSLSALVDENPVSVLVDDSPMSMLVDDRLVCVGRRQASVCAGG